MKTINFSAVEVLPSLLNKTKQQTIRPAWKSIWGVAPSVEFTESKQPRFKVGDEVKLMWNEKSKAEWFDRTKGEGLDIKQIKPDFKCMCFNKLLGTATITEVFEIEMSRIKRGWRCKSYKEYEAKWMDENAMPVETDMPVEYIINTPITVNPIGQIESGRFEINNRFLDILAERDGFKSAEEMFEWFDKNYDLSKPKKFLVIRWRWNN